VHVILGLVCVICGALAMLSPKRTGRHPRFGSVYFWSLAGVFVTASALATARWAEDYQLFGLAVLSFALAVFGRQARRRQWAGWPRWHMTGMGLSYIVLLTAFYVDNGKNLPVWRDLPAITYWLAPSLMGLPILAWALLRHPLVRVSEASGA
jgi:peptidoglycan/LPS O-acetylase OafA/YrhL